MGHLASPVTRCMSSGSGQQMQLAGGPLQVFTEGGRRDGDQRPRAFREVATVQRGDAVFGHDIVDVRT